MSAGRVGGSMRVEIHRRPAGASLTGVPPPKRSASANPGLVEAYSDSCFESPTHFYIASPEHPKLGKWAKPSTLKYSQSAQLQANQSTTQFLDNAELFASSQGRPRTTGRKPTRRVKTAAAPAPENHRRSSPKPLRALGPHRQSKPGRVNRPISPAGALLAGSAESPPVSSIRGRREAPRIDTPVSGRVAPLHQRSFQMSTLPSSPTLCGSFDRQYHPRTRSAGPKRSTQDPASFDWSTPGRPTRAPVVFDMAGVGFDTECAGEGEGRGDVVGPRQEGGQIDEPDVPYRVAKLDDPFLGGDAASPSGDLRHCSSASREGHLCTSSTFDQATPQSLQKEPLAGKRQPFASATPGGSRGDSGRPQDGSDADADPWVAAQLDPFMSALRQALIRDRPADVPAYASTFSVRWQER